MWDREKEEKVPVDEKAELFCVDRPSEVGIRGVSAKEITSRLLCCVTVALERSDSPKQLVCYSITYFLERDIIPTTSNKRAIRDVMNVGTIVYR